MAEKLKSFEFTALHGNMKYPWDKWTDGDIWCAKRGEDYQITSTGFVQRLRQKASDSATQKVKVEIQGEQVVFQFYNRPFLSV